MADEKEDALDSPDPHFEPVVTLSPVEIKTLEEEEKEIFKMRAKLFRYDSISEPAEWKERGTGEVKLLQHIASNRIRVLMRRDKTLKICANHYISPSMELKPNCGSDRAWVWSTPADFADEESKTELLAIRFASAENAQKFKEKFEFCQQLIAETESRLSNGVSVPAATDSESQANGEGLAEAAKCVDQAQGEGSPVKAKTGENDCEEKLTSQLCELSVQDCDKKVDNAPSETAAE